MSWFVEHLHRDGSVLSRTPVVNNRFTIGRALDNDLVLDDPHVAGHHAELALVGEHRATLRDLGSLNGVALQRSKKQAEIEVLDEKIHRVGSSWIRVRSSSWALAPEQPMEHRYVWLYALLALGVVVGDSLWEVWLSDRQPDSPPYLYMVASIVGFIAIWSAAYAVYGRLANGTDRFFNHLLIASCGALALTWLENLLNAIAFAWGWLWPMQWSPYLLGMGLALVIRAHLRTADPRHWRSTRWALAIITACGIALPLAQQWISDKEFTSVRTMDHLSYPALRLAPAQTPEDFLRQAAALKGRAQKAIETETSDGDAEPLDEL